MAELQWTAPMASHDDQPARLSSPALEIAALARFGLVWVQIREPNDPVLDRVADALGFQLPQIPNTSTGQGPLALWTAPGEWMLAADAGGADRLAARISESLEGDLARASNVTDSRAGFLVSGPKAINLLSKGCGLDLHPSVFPEGSCAGTRFAGISALLHRTRELDSYRLYVDRSYAEYLWHWLSQAGQWCTFTPALTVRHRLT